MAVTDWKYPQTVNIEDLGEIYFTWTNSNNVKIDDAANASVVFPATNDPQTFYTDYLLTTNYDFGLSTRAIIRGIEVSLERQATGLNSVKDNLIKLIKTGTISGDSKASDTTWISDLTVATYGGAADLWGCTLLNTDLITTFGIALQLKCIIGFNSETTGFVDYVKTRVYYGDVTGDWEYTTYNSVRLITVDASELIPSTDETIVSYEWDWGDTSNNSTGALNSHFYDADGSYTVTLTVELSGGGTIDISREITFMAITSISPFFVTEGDEVTIIGTDFGATGGTATLGGVALTSTTWAATKIIGKVGTSATLGDATLVVTTSTTVSTTAADIAYIYGADNYSTTELKLGTMSRMYMDGLHVGYLQDTVEIMPSTDVKDYIPNDQNTIVKTFIIKNNLSVKFTLSQINPVTMAAVVGGTYTLATKTIVLGNATTVPEVSLAWEDASGVFYYIPRCQLIEPSNITLNATDNQSLPVTYRALPNTAGTVAQITFPA